VKIRVCQRKLLVGITFETGREERKSKTYSEMRSLDPPPLISERQSNPALPVSALIQQEVCVIIPEI